MVHADASNFAEGVTKEEAYEQVLLQAKGLFDGQRNWVIPTTTQQPSELGRLLHARSARDGHAAAHPRPVPGQGGVPDDPLRPRRVRHGASTRTTQLVPDVEKFPGHIACDGDSKSEIVVPIVVGEGDAGKVVAIIDVDCADLNGFDEVDRKYLERLAVLLARGCDW
ncbi:hypothetical protein NUW58_g8738 [Xylaria curta]|uniref:Uncharacterized protein n=1 Tax=Xylaria curta TaxID=42375 RepID=A0ACC1N6T3_9PEZI|nr:hypothetical protein NUW58_g8738 [Xylaria curta]